MSLSTRTMRISHNTNGTVSTFAMPDVPIVDDSAEVKVYLRDESVWPATVTLQTEGSGNDYTLIGAPDADSFHTTVSFNSAPANGLIVTVTLTQTFSQTLDYDGNNSAGVRPTQLEERLDVLTGFCQELEEKLSRVPILGPTTQVAAANMDAPDPKTGTVGVFGFGTDGNMTLFTTVELVEDYETMATSAIPQIYVTEDIGSNGTVTISDVYLHQTRRVQGDGAAQVANQYPFGTTGGWLAGTVIRLVGQNNTNTIEFQHNGTSGTLGDFGMELNGNAVLGKNDSIDVQWDNLQVRWVEVGRNF